MALKFYKYQGTGNDFIIVDNRNLIFDKNNSLLIQKLCNRKTGVGSDGLILLENHKNLDFKMVYFNADSSESGFCGNGSRCITHFAKFLGIVKDSARFEAIDGIHLAKIIDDKISVKINNIDASKIKHFNNGYNATFVDSGSPHLLIQKSDINNFDIIRDSKSIKNHFKKTFTKGVNINYFSVSNDIVNLRTYERGVEDETLSCGTGAVALAVCLETNSKINNDKVLIFTKGGELKVSLKKIESTYSDIWLSGGVEQVYSGEYNLDK